MVKIIISIFVIAIFFLITFVIKTQKNWQKLIPAKEVQELGLGEIISFFKEQKNIEKLKSSQNYIAVALKKFENDKSHIIACIFDKEKNSVVDIEFATAWNAKTLSADLNEMFADKEMIIVQ